MPTADSSGIIRFCNAGHLLVSNGVIHCGQEGCTCRISVREVIVDMIRTGELSPEELMPQRPQFVIRGVERRPRFRIISIEGRS